MNNTKRNNQSLDKKDVVVIGVPLDNNSSYKRGAAAAPEKIREALFCESSNLFTESRLDLGSTDRWQVLPDLELSEDRTAFRQIENEIKRLLKNELRVISLGGDHSITLPVIRAYAEKYTSLNILHLDAHPDLYDELDGNRYSHACPFARIMEEKLVQRVVQAGIRTLTDHQYDQAQRFGVDIIEMKNIVAVKDLLFDGPVYLSLDIDCLDPAFAPGVSHHEPGGMSTRDVLEILQNLKGNLVGADIVEFNPDQDLNGMTGMVAGKLLKELLDRFLQL